MRKLGLIVLLFFIGSQLKAQKLIKAHFEVIASSEIDMELYAEVLDNMYVDSLRFVHERRTIQFADKPVKIILYSGDELLASLGKIISPFNLVDPASAKKIKFILAEDNVIKIIDSKE